MKFSRLPNNKYRYRQKVFNANVDRFYVRFVFNLRVKFQSKRRHELATKPPPKDGRTISEAMALSSTNPLAKSLARKI